MFPKVEIPARGRKPPLPEVMSIRRNALPEVMFSRRNVKPALMKSQSQTP